MTTSDGVSGALGPRLGERLVLCNISVSTVPLAEMIPAAAHAGFDAISIIARAHRRALRREGSSDDELRRLLADHGLVVAEVEAVGDWLEAPDVAERPWLDTIYSEREYLDLAETYGAPVLVAVHFGPPVPLDAAATAFAGLCDRAAERGIRVALEYPAMATIADMHAAWTIVELADRPNGGILVDTWHHRRSGGTDGDLAVVPAERIFALQVADGSAEPRADLADDVAFRDLPGLGELALAPMIAGLDARGVRCPIGVEVYDAALIAGGAEPAAVTLFRTFATLLADAGLGDRHPRR
jgi:sugar phosphate isomerase/epimerase